MKQKITARPLVQITDYGARPDGQSLNTEAIQSAIDACHQQGGGTVVCGPGDFLTGSITLKSNVTLHLEAGCRIVGSASLDAYATFTSPGYRHDRAPERSSICLIGAAGAERIAITGRGQIDASGPAFYDTTTTTRGRYPRPNSPRPRLLMMHRCRDVHIEGVALIDSPCWTCWLMQCQTVTIRGITIRGDQHMHNNDGLDIDACTDVTVSDCSIQTDDDCIVIRAIQPCYDSQAVCENITVTNCILQSTCQGVRVGCPDDGTIRHCLLSNLVIHSSKNGISFENPKRYLQPQSTGSADIHDVAFCNVTIQCQWSALRIVVEEGIALQRLSDLRFSHLRAQSGHPSLIAGSPQTMIENIRISDSHLESAGTDPIVCQHCRGVELNNVELSSR